MANILIAYRYCLFGLFLICQAIICSVATWNLGLAQEAGFSPKIDIYLIFIGALGVFYIIPIIFLDLFHKNSITNRVWFECLWVSVFWMMELAGAAALTATVPNKLCTADAEAVVLNSCTSTEVLVAFTWICSLALLVYVVALPVSAVLHHDEDEHVWTSSVRFFPWYAMKASIPGSPSVRSWQKRSFVLAAPKPKRPVVLQATFADLEKAAIPSATLIVPPSYKSPAAPPPMQHSLREVITVPQQKPSRPSFYPSAVQAHVAQQARDPERNEPTPPPLGEWPRSMKSFQPRQGHVPSPLVIERKPVPVGASARTAVPPSATVPTSARRPVPASARPAYHVEATSARLAPTSARRLPQVPPPRTEVSRQQGSTSPSRRPPPPPLNLNGISAYQAIDARRNF